MSEIGSMNRKLVTVVGLMLLAAAAAVFYCARHYSQPHYHDSFASGKTAEWRAYGGSWDFYEDAIRNNSDERGAYVQGADLSAHSASPRFSIQPSRPAEANFYRRGTCPTEVQSGEC